MNITPLEIRQKEFEKGFRGYDKDEVSAFLNSLSIEWERLNDQCKELKLKLESAENEVVKLREVENSLFKTLKTAEDTGSNMIEQATKTAELHMKETEMKADGLMNEAKSRARSIIEEAENRARIVIDDMEDEIRQLEQVFRSLDSNKTSLISDLKLLAGDILSKIERHEDFPAEIKSHIKKGKDLSREVNDSTSKPVDVDRIIVENEHKAAEASISEMVEDAPEDVEETSPVIEDEMPSADLSVAEESQEVEAEQEVIEEATPPVAEVKAEEESTEGTSKESKQSGSFFDQFD
ncbi:DivIVA domain-containing protein [Roseivirga sp.]|uniref:DivIVA domain-containing protein n=1 Tax=Roseivirga sp. TaxID=1964215 RepID=UPI003B8D9005